jgi:hypothetical protein
MGNDYNALKFLIFVFKIIGWGLIVIGGVLLFGTVCMASGGARALPQDGPNLFASLSAFSGFIFGFGAALSGAFVLASSELFQIAVDAMATLAAINGHLYQLEDTLKRWNVPVNVIRDESVKTTRAVEALASTVRKT